MHLSKFFLLLLAFIAYEVSAARPHKTLVASIAKDTKTSLYSIRLNINEHYVIDLSSPFLWYNCPLQHPLVICRSPQCLQAQSYPPPSCILESKQQLPQVPCTCLVTPVNPVTKLCASAQLTYKNFAISSINGSTPTGSITFSNTYVSCAPDSLLKSLPKGAIGLAGISTAPLALVSQFTPSFLGLSKKFAICLPDTDAAPGLVFFGDGPYNLLPPTNFDVASILTYTPLQKIPKSPDYYIDIKAISIGGKAIPVPRKSLAADKLGHSGVKLSTVVPYTTLRADVYKAFVNSFIESTQGLPQLNAVKPFRLCFNSTAIGFSRVGLHVPPIDLELANGKNWTIFGANSMKQVSEEIACLAFVNGGKTAEQAVLIGSFQMENNFLLFDLAKSTLGFSSSLFFIRTTCGNFNFTNVP
ncbi:basic 7S globulin 2-like [Coffea eugenioides]|uniref:Chitinase CLP-like n=1 Tax=Coffea arabica TaxID=13443 RepID=A0A6P6X2V4_COFAR|nr:basic 7S globulin 2-like [Coffea arabica]XP_027120192.1 basic 7S globulin 2-like [Coffea arabica]XP_027164825.1 basic 7S globulin 2-like [Coffea eugenioides]